MRFFATIVAVHKWLGIAVGLWLAIAAVTGFLLLIKKDYAWIQPPTAHGAPGEPAQYRPLHEVYAAVFALGLPQLRSEADIERVDFRPARRIHKVHSVHDHLEVQVDAVTLQVHGPAVRRSDWIEQLHDGQKLGIWVHDWLLPAVAVAFVLLTGSGYALWLWPKWKRRSLARRRADGATRDVRGG